jgi:hypothetical protein
MRIAVSREFAFRAVAFSVVLAAIPSPRLRAEQPPAQINCRYDPQYAKLMQLVGKSFPNALAIPAPDDHGRASVIISDVAALKAAKSCEGPDSSTIRLRVLVGNVRQSSGSTGPDPDADLIVYNLGVRCSVYTLDPTAAKLLGITVANVKRATMEFRFNFDPVRRGEVGISRLATAAQPKYTNAAGDIKVVRSRSASITSLDRGATVAVMSGQGRNLRYSVVPPDKNAKAGAYPAWDAKKGAYVFPQGGTLVAKVVAVDPGPVGNLPAEPALKMAPLGAIDGIASISGQGFSGGTEGSADPNATFTADGTATTYDFNSDEVAFLERCTVRIDE